MAKKSPGRPPISPEKLKTVRFSLRLHPDMYDALGQIADHNGLNRSVTIQQILVAAVNAEWGYRAVTAHGQYVSRAGGTLQTRNYLGGLRPIGQPRAALQPAPHFPPEPEIEGRDPRGMSARKKR